jgi:flavin reductase (DIM6/NTAB) family NADH-FMN oxidoreductase RutF
MSTRIFRTADIGEMEQRFRANLINSLTGFKSVNLIGTADAEGQTNLAVFSQVVHLGANPPLVGIIFRPDTVARHTLANITETGYFTLNHICAEFYERAHQTSAKYPAHVSEFEACGLTPEFSEQHPAPYVRESQVKMGAKLAQRIDLEINGTILLIGELIEINVPEKYLGADGYLDIEGAGTVTSSALDGYHTTQLLSRLPYARP